jgi:hypothetical protein
MRIALSQSRVPGERLGRSRIGRGLGLPALAAALLALACFAMPASADTGTKIIERCTHGQSIGGFSQRAYRRALQELPTEVEEYSDCANLIRRAQLAAAGGQGGGLSGGGGSSVATATPLSPAERTSLGSVPKTGAEPLHVGGGLLHPGVVHTNIASAFNSLPDPLLAVLAFLLVSALALGGRTIVKGVRAHRAG